MRLCHESIYRAVYHAQSRLIRPPQVTPPRTVTHGKPVVEALACRVVGHGEADRDADYEGHNPEHLCCG
jgi:hypothetical protein